MQETFRTLPGGVEASQAQLISEISSSLASGKLITMISKSKLYSRFTDHCNDGGFGFLYEALKWDLCVYLYNCYSNCILLSYFIF